MQCIEGGELIDVEALSANNTINVLIIVISPFQRQPATQRELLLSIT